MNLNGTAGHVPVPLAVVYENAQLLRPNLISAKSEHKQHGVYYVRLSASVRSHDTRKTLRTKYKNPALVLI